MGNRALCLSGLSWGASSLKSLPTAKDGKQGALSLCVPRELQCGGTQRQQQRRWRKRRAGQHLRVQHLPGHSQRRRHQPVRPPLLVSAPGPERTLLVEHSALARGGEGLPHTLGPDIRRPKHRQPGFSCQLRADPPPPWAPDPHLCSNNTPIEEHLLLATCLLAKRQGSTMV